MEDETQLPSRRVSPFDYQCKQKRALETLQGEKNAWRGKSPRRLLKLPWGKLPLETIVTHQGRFRGRVGHIEEGGKEKTVKLVAMGNRGGIKLQRPRGGCLGITKFYEVTDANGVSVISIELTVGKGKAILMRKEPKGVPIFP